MDYFLLRETLERCAPGAPGRVGGEPYAAVVTPAEWEAERERFDMGIELEPDLREIHSTKAEVNFDSLTGTFRIPDRTALSERSRGFAFALDEKGIVFIDESGLALEMIEAIRRTRRWRKPCLERFLYDFLEQVVSADLPLIEGYESELDDMEDELLSGGETADMVRLSEIRSDVRTLRVHYEQLVDMAQELEENENGFFHEDDLRYLHLFLNRMGRLEAAVSALRDHAAQVMDLYHGRQEVRQNNIMTLLTVVATIFMPLTLIAGWYGMNFRYMPELAWPWAYPAVFAVSVLIVVVSLVYFKKKKWM